MSRLGKSAATVAALVAVLALLRPATAAKPPSTDLLFPYLVNTAGFDTEFTISNTGADAFGTIRSEGGCVVTFYQQGTANPIVIPGTLEPGQTFTFLLSVINPGFRGYAIAHCDLAFAHGTIRISDLGARNLAASYPALVLPAKRAKTNEHLGE
jgi:hypothetical protein